MNLAATLKALIKKAEISESELARQTGVAQPIIHRILNSQNTNPKLETLKGIADYFAITISQLIGEIPLNIERSDLKTTTAQGLFNIPLISWEDAVSWSKKIESIKKNAVKILTTFPVSKLAYCLKVENSSIEAVFPKNTLLIIEPEKAPKDKDYIVIKLKTHSAATLKQLVFDGENRYLKPLNPDLKNISLPLMKKEDSCKGTIVQAIISY